MTLRDARTYFYLSREIEAIKTEIQNLQLDRKYYRAIILSDMPRGSAGTRNVTDDYLERSERLKRRLAARMKRRMEERIRFEQFLASVEDQEIRTIIYMRCIGMKSWEEIGQELHRDRRTISRIFYRYFDTKTGK